MREAPSVVVVGTGDLVQQVRDPADGFHDRYRLVLGHLHAEGRLRGLVLTGVDRVPEAVHEVLPDASGIQVVGGGPATPDGSRRRFLRAAGRAVARPSSREPWEHDLRRAVLASGADVALVIAHRHRIAMRAVCDALPTVLVAEEDFSTLPEYGAGRLHPLLGAIERGALRRAMHGAATVAVIADGERDWATRQFPGCPVVVLPAFVDCRFFRPPPDAAAWRARRFDIVIYGAMTRERNRAGLLAFLQALADRPEPPSVALLSGTGIPGSLAQDHPFVTVIGRAPDPAPWLADARVCVVPSTTVTGVKSTVLQAWAAGTPVVTTEASARSVAGRDGHDVLVACSPAELADRARSLLAQESPALALAACAAQRACAERHPRVGLRCLDEVLAGVAPR